MIQKFLDQAERFVKAYKEACERPTLDHFLIESILEDVRNSNLAVIEALIVKIISLESRTLKTNCDPEANGRVPEDGDERWIITVPLESGESLTIQMGKKGRDNLFGMLIADCNYHDESEPE